MELGLRSKVAIVTGASRGIGRATAEAFAEEGCRLAICARTAGPLEEARAAIAALGVEVYARPCDLADPVAIDRFVAGVLDRFGTTHILVTIAPRPPKGPVFDELSDPDWLASLEGKFLSYIRLSRAVLPAMRRQRWGRIVHVGGLAGRQPGKSFVAGSAIHASLPNLAKSMADTYGRENIHVTVVTPSAIVTEHQQASLARSAAAAGVDLATAEADFLADVALGRLGTPREVAEVIVFLCSERASYMTGCEILVDGGRSRGI